MNETYHAQVDLLLRVLPHVAAEACFALKGGTALNLFVRDMPHPPCACRLTSTWPTCPSSRVGCRCAASPTPLAASRRQWPTTCPVSG